MINYFISKNQQNFVNFTHFGNYLFNIQKKIDPATLNLIYFTDKNEFVDSNKIVYPSNENKGDGMFSVLKMPDVNLN